MCIPPKERVRHGARADLAPAPDAPTSDAAAPAETAQEFVARVNDELKELGRELEEETAAE